jgi:hypothetical protein
LIYLKAPAKAADYDFSINHGEINMPLDSILVVIAVTMMFATFGVVLEWGERQTRTK